MLPGMCGLAVELRCWAPLRGLARKSRRTLARRAPRCVWAERRRREELTPANGAQGLRSDFGCWDRRDLPGVDSARLPFPTKRPLGVGWPPQVRAVDAPASQDVPA